MSSSSKNIFLGSIFLALAIALGAFGAHGLKSVLTGDQLAAFQTGVQYHIYHSFALIITGVLYRTKSSARLKQASICFLIGLLLFSGSLYVVTIGYFSNFDLKWIAAITPLGGISFMAGWILIAISFYKKV